MLWLYLLAAITLLVIALRRVLLRQQPLNDALYSSRVAIEHVHSGVAWVRADGLISTVNPALLATLGASGDAVRNSHWHAMFATHELERVEAAYRQALIAGAATIQTQLKRGDGSLSYVELLMVTIHDHKTRFVGHYCLVEDQTAERELKAQVQELTASLSTKSMATAVARTPFTIPTRRTETAPPTARVAPTPVAPVAVAPVERTPEPEPVIEPVSAIQSAVLKPKHKFSW